MKKTNHQQNVRSIAIKTFQILIILSIVGSAMVGPVAAVTATNEVWTDGNLNGPVVDTATDTSGNRYVVVNNANSRLEVYSFDTSGNINWQTVTDGSVLDYTGKKHQILTTAGGNVYVTGQNETVGGDPFIWELSSSTGNILNSQQVDGTSDDEISYISSAVNSAGTDVLHVGIDDNPVGLHQYLLYDQSLTLQSQKDLSFVPYLSTNKTHALLTSGAGLNTVAGDVRVFDSSGTEVVNITNANVRGGTSALSDHGTFYQWQGESGRDAKHYVVELDMSGNIINQNLANYQGMNREMVYAPQSDRLLVSHPDNNDLRAYTPDLSSYVTYEQTVNVGGTERALTSGFTETGVDQYLAGSHQYSGVVEFRQLSPNFQVERTSDNQPVIFGDIYSVNVNVNNTGGIDDTQTVSLTVNGDLKDSESVTLNANSETDITLTWQTTQSAIGTNSATIASDDDSVSYNIEVKDTVQSIDLTANDQTLLPGQSSSYTVTGTNKSGSNPDLTSESSVSSSDATTVSVDEVNTELNYQSDGSVTITADYTNNTGTVLTDSINVETDTPQIDLSVEYNPIGTGIVGDYTVTNTTFGSSVDVTSSATVTSSDSLIISVQSSQNTYTGESVGTATLTASDGGYSDQVSVDVIINVESISLDIDDTQLLSGQSSDYIVNGTEPDGTIVDMTDESNTSPDDSSIVTVDEVSRDVTYQSDGSTVVRASHLNATGELLWSNVTVETDTPVISLNLEANPVELDPGGVSASYNYTVTNTTFGTSTNVSLQATVTSDNLTVVTIDEPNLNYVAQSVGIANLTASDGGYSDTVQVEVDPPSELIYENWDYMSSGEKSIVMFSDWTILWLLGSVIVSVLFAKSYRAPRVGIMIFTGLQVIGWVTGFVPGYVVLSIVIVEVFFGFLINFTFSAQNANS